LSLFVSVYSGSTVLQLLLLLERAATDAEALDAFQLFARLEGIIPALETSHAIHGAIIAARAMPREQTLVINVSGRGDKDVTEVMRLLGME
jgi:tryptophan synthase beta chain